MILYQLEHRRIRKQKRGNKTRHIIGLFLSLKKLEKWLKKNHKDWANTKRSIFAVCQYDLEETADDPCKTSHCIGFYDRTGKPLNSKEVLGK